MDRVFKALADSARRQLLDQLHDKNGQTLTELCRGLDMSRQAVSKHLAILAKADLVVPLWNGREKFHYMNPAPLQQISDRWIGKYQRSCDRALIDLERGLEHLKSTRT